MVDKWTNLASRSQPAQKTGPPAPTGSNRLLVSAAYHPPTHAHPQAHARPTPKQPEELHFGPSPAI
ncbi:MAG: hypothetical protein Q8P59_07235 [Dehalococcoidia bacterium]|nr:hypothetical protein [Dehalococcoidia bacterium]